MKPGSFGHLQECGTRHGAKEAKELSGDFWTDLQRALNDFDKAHPEGHRPAGTSSMTTSTDHPGIYDGKKDNARGNTTGTGTGNKTIRTGQEDPSS